MTQVLELDVTCQTTKANAVITAVKTVLPCKEPAINVPPVRRRAPAHILYDIQPSFTASRPAAKKVKTARPGSSRGGRFSIVPALRSKPQSGAGQTPTDLSYFIGMMG